MDDCSYFSSKRILYEKVLKDSCDDFAPLIRLKLSFRFGISSRNPHGTSGGQLQIGRRRDIVGPWTREDERRRIWRRRRIMSTYEERSVRAIIRFTAATARNWRRAKPGQQLSTSTDLTGR